MSENFGGFDSVPGANDMAEQAGNKKAWFRRWYVWVLPGLVILGVLAFAYN